MIDTKDIVKVGDSYSYKGYWIFKAKKGNLKGFSCSIHKVQKPLTLEAIVTMIDQKVGA
jgi:hypothetical protein